VLIGPWCFAVGLMTKAHENRKKKILSTFNSFTEHPCFLLRGVLRWGFSFEWWEVSRGQCPMPLKYDGLLFERPKQLPASPNLLRPQLSCRTRARSAVFMRCT